MTVLVGDLAAIHDSHGLLIAQQYQLPVRVVVLNNQGGGIFYSLPIAEQPEYFERLFATPHQTSFAGLAAAAGASYRLGTPESSAEGLLLGPQVVELKFSRLARCLQRAHHGSVPSHIETCQAARGRGALRDLRRGGRHGLRDGRRSASS